MIEPDTLSALSDGDVLTFGKSVGKDDGVVRPVTARVRLLFSPPPAPALPVQPATPVTPASSAHPSSSGRYGIYTPAMTSSGSDSSSESDVEEIPPPQPDLQHHMYASLNPWGFMRGTHAHYPHAMHHLNHTRHAHPIAHGPSGPSRLGLLRRILPRIESIEEIASGRGDNRFSPISVSSFSRSPSIVEVNRAEVHPLSPAREKSVVGAFPESVPGSRAQSPIDDAGEDMDIESNAPSEYSSKRNDESHDIDVAEDIADFPFPVLMASSRICTPEPMQDDNEDMYATPTGPLEHDSRPDSYVADMLQPNDFLEHVSHVPESLPAHEPFESRVETLKNKLANLEQQMLVVNESEVEAEPVTPAQRVVTENASEADVKAFKEMLQGESSHVSSFPLVDIPSGYLLALDELRKKAEADLAKELEAVRVARAEAEAAAAAAKQAAVIQKSEVSSACCAAHARETHAAQAVDESLATFSLKRKRDDHADDDLRVTPRASSCQVLFDRLAAEPPHKRTRTSDKMAVAKRVVAGVARTTAIAAVGAVAAWSALAYS